MQWLDGTVPETDLLVMPVAGVFVVEEMGAKRAVQGGFSL
jgi:hypothetical protein